MKNLIFVSIFVLLSSGLLSAQEATYVRKSQGMAASREAQGVKVFDVNRGEAVVKIKWDLDKLKYQLIFKKAPSILEHYVKESFPRDNITKIIFLDKDGFKVTERLCYVGSYTYEKDGQTLVCRNSSDDDRMLFSIEEYRKIAGASVLINPDPAN